VELSLNDLLTVAGVAVVVAILVQVLKQWLREDLVPLLALLLGMVLAVAASAALGMLTPEAIGNALLTGLLGGASAIGIYETQSHTRQALR
jgi:predicted RND superfamily exporter protein